MRIALATQFLQRIGGVETYLSDIIPALRLAGHELAVLGALSENTRTDTIFREQPDFPVWRVDQTGANKSLAELSAWKPDVVYAHGMQDPTLEAAAMNAAPSVFFLHVYHGTCISGAKRWARPVVRPCHRRFGLGCLLHYYPHRCGGLSPITMMRHYFAQKRRLVTIRNCQAVVTHSFHMYKECLLHGLDEKRLHRFVYYSPDDAIRADARNNPLAVIEAGFSRPWQPALPAKVLFVGRLDLNKGVDLLIEAAGKLPAMLDRKIELTIAGDGPERHRLMKLVERSRVRSPGAVSVEFAGWLNRGEVRRRMAESDLVAFPSVWPEPFGLVGPEAGHLGVPVAAFDVGGVKSWMVDGVNGRLAPGEPPTAQGLAIAIAHCLRDEKTYRRLCRGAIEMAARFSRASHLAELETVLAEVAGKPHDASLSQR